MEFFNWFGVAQIILQLWRIDSVTSLEQGIAEMRNIMYIGLGVAAGVFILTLVLGGLGIMKLCKKAGIGHGWLGFFPFANTYMVGKLAGETRVFGTKMKRAGLYATIAEAVYVIIEIMALVSTALTLRPEYFAPLNDPETQELVGFEMSRMLVPDEIWTFSLVVEILAYIGEFVLIFFFCVLFFAFFKKYYARGPYLMTFLCAIMPFRGFVLFAVRKNSPIDYEALRRRRMQQAQSMYGYPMNGPYDGQGGYNGNGQGGYGGANGGYGGTQGGGSDSPFSDFGGSPSDDSDGSSNGGTPSGGGSDSPFSDF